MNDPRLFDKAERVADYTLEIIPVSDAESAVTEAEEFIATVRNL